MTPGRLPHRPDGQASALQHVVSVQTEDNAEFWRLPHALTRRPAQGERSMPVYIWPPTPRATTSLRICARSSHGTHTSGVSISHITQPARQVQGQECAWQILPNRANLDISFIEETSPSEIETFAMQQSHQTLSAVRRLSLGNATKGSLPARSDCNHSRLPRLDQGLRQRSGRQYSAHRHEEDRRG